MIALKVNGQVYDQWTEAEVSRDMEDISGSFSFTLRVPLDNEKALFFVSMRLNLNIQKGDKAEVLVDNQVVLIGWVEKKEKRLEDGQASVTISGRDVTGDLVDTTALPDGPAELRNIKYEDAVKQIAKPYGIKVRSEVDTGDVFDRYSIDVSEMAMSAIEKGARSRKVLILSDGVGALVITRTGAAKAPVELTLPGNVLSSSFSQSDEEQYSETTVRGQSEKAAKKRKSGPLDATAEPLSVDARTPSDGSATKEERAGTAATGKAKSKSMKRYRPIVHLARSKADQKECQDQADWKQRNTAARSEELVHVVKDHSVNGKVWRINEMASVEDAWQDIYREMLIRKVTFRQAEDENPSTELMLVDPDAYDPNGKGKQQNRTNKHTGKATKSKKSGPLDGTAEAL